MTLKLVSCLDTRRTWCKFFLEGGGVQVGAEAPASRSIAAARGEGGHLNPSPARLQSFVIASPAPQLTRESRIVHKVWRKFGGRSKPVLVLLLLCTDLPPPLPQLELIFEIPLSLSQACYALLCHKPVTDCKIFTSG